MDLPEDCPICGYSGFIINTTDSSREYVCDCDRCGKYFTTHNFLLFRHNEECTGNWHGLSGLVREINERNNNHPFIMEKELDELFEDSRIPKDDDIQAKSGKILRYLRDKSPHYGAKVELHLERDRSVAYAVDQNEFVALLRLLDDSGYVNAEIISTMENTGECIEPEVEVSLTSQGWELAKGLGQEIVDSRQGFIAIRFDDDADPFIGAIEKGIENAGYEPECIKEKHYSERVMDKALGEIRRSKFVIVDLTKNRCAVSFEAGFAHALGIECIFFCQKDERVEDFYSKHYKYVEYENKEDLQQKVEEAVRSRIGQPSSFET